MKRKLQCLAVCLFAGCLLIGCKSETADNQHIIDEENQTLPQPAETANDSLLQRIIDSQAYAQYCEDDSLIRVKKSNHSLSIYAQEADWPTMEIAAVENNNYQLYRAYQWSDQISYVKKDQEKTADLSLRYYVNTLGRVSELDQVLLVSLTTQGEDTATYSFYYDPKKRVPYIQNENLCAEELYFTKDLENKLAEHLGAALEMIQNTDQKAVVLAKQLAQEFNQQEVFFIDDALPYTPYYPLLDETWQEQPTALSSKWYSISGIDYADENWKDYYGYTGVMQLEIYLDSEPVSALNKALKEEGDALIKERNGNGEDWSVSAYREFRIHEVEGILSIQSKVFYIIKDACSSGPFWTVYNIDLESGELIDNTELFARLELDEKALEILKQHSQYPPYSLNQMVGTYSDEEIDWEHLDDLQIALAQDRLILFLQRVMETYSYDYGASAAILELQ